MSLVVFVLSALALAGHASPAPQAASSLESQATSAFASATGAAASALPTVLGDWPSLQDIQDKLDLNDTQINQIPVNALLIPSYANHTDQGWNVRFYGLTYRLPNVSADDLTSIINGFKTDNLNQTQQSLLQNRTQDLASIPVPKANLTATVLRDGQNVTNGPISLQTADDVGEIDQFVVVPGLGNEAANGVQVVQTGILNVSPAPQPSNGTSILVPSTGISVVSDIDDVLRITKVYIPNQGLYNSFVEPYVNVPYIPELFAQWLKQLPNASFHYDTTTPVQLTRTYVEYLFNNFPLGSLDMRPINISEPSAILDARMVSLTKLFQTFPQRKFVLVGDTSSSTLLSAYPQIAQQYPNQLACIFIRNTSATDSDDKIPYNTKEFQNIRNGSYFFYNTAQDLMGLDVAGGQCVNESIPQHVEFGEQGGVLGSSSGALASVLDDAAGKGFKVWMVVAAGAALLGSIL